MPHGGQSVVIVPTSAVNLLTEHALNAALSLGDTVVAVAVAGDEEECEQVRAAWREWACSVPLEVIIDPHRSLVRSVLSYVKNVPREENTTITVLIPEVIPTKRRREILHNQRGRLLATVLKSQTDVVVATLPFHVKA